MAFLKDLFVILSIWVLIFIWSLSYKAYQYRLKKPVNKKVERIGFVLISIIVVVLTTLLGWI